MSANVYQSFDVFRLHELGAEVSGVDLASRMWKWLEALVDQLTQSIDAQLVDRRNPRAPRAFSV